MFSKENLTVQKNSGKKKLKNRQYFQEPERITPNLVGYFVQELLYMGFK